MKLSTAYILAVIFIAGPSYAAAQGAQKTQARVIDSLVKDAIDSQRISSLSVAVVRGRDTVSLTAYGLAWREPAIPTTSATVYRMGSIAKQFTASVMLQLVDEGRMSLNDPIDKFLPRLPAAWRTVRIREVLNHTSGIPSYTNLGPAWSSRMTEDFSPDSLIALTTGKPLDFPTGTNWRYNNSGYVIAGRIIERVEGKPYATVVDERIAKPLGLESLSYCLTNPEQGRDAAGYETAPNKTFQDAVPISLTQPYAAGGLCITARDLVKWNAALHGGKVVSLKSYQRMTTPEGSAVPRGYGYGIVRDSSVHGVRLVHGGGINGFVSSNSYTPANQLSIVVLGNTGTGEVDKLAAQITRLMDGKALEHRATPIALSETALAAHVGKFELALPGRTMPVELRMLDGKLAAYFDSQSPTMLVPIGEHLFIVEQDEQIVMDFVVDETGAITGFVLTQGVTYHARRIS